MNAVSNADFGPALPGAGPTAPSAAAPVEGRGLEIGDLLRILTERRYIILSGVALGLIVGIVISLLLTPMYRATALLELNSPASQVIEQASGDSQPSRAVNGDELMATQLGLLRSESLARRVVQDLNLTARPEFGGGEGTREEKLDRAVEVLQDNTVVESIRDSMLIRVSYVSPEPALASRIANALASGFISSSLERRYDSSSYARDFLRNQLAATKNALEESERQLNAYAISSGIFRTPGRTADGVTTESPSLAVSNLEALNTALNQARIRRINAEQAYRAGASQQANPSNASVASLREQRALLQAEYDDRARLFKSDYPEMRQIQSRIDAIDRAIAAERSAGSSTRSADLQAEFRAAQAAEQQIAGQVAAIKSDVQSERGRSIQYNILQREVDTNRALYDALLQRYKEIGVAGGVGQSNVSSVDEASPPQAPFRPNLFLNAALGLLVGLGLGIAAAVIAHLLFDTIVTPGDVRSKLGMPVLGVIPAERDGLSLYDALADRKSEISEAYYSLRTALQFVRPEGPPKTLLVSSTRPGEGKSTTAFAIAANFARNGERVLLIDADLRKPTFVSKQEGNRGLAWLLSNESPIGSYAEETSNPNLSLLPVGRYTGSAAELLASARLPRIIADAREHFDRVVLDGPPVLGLADAPLLGALAEGTLVVVESHEARTANVTEMIRRLKASGTSILGVVLTKVRSSGGGYDYYSYSYGSDGAGGKVTSDPARAIDVNPETAPNA